MREDEKSFNLLDQPWIKVLTQERTVKQVSLKDAILNAHEYVGLAGELPTQDYAVLRLLLAVLFAVFCRMDTDGNDSLLNRKNAVKRWKLLWAMGRFPLKPIEQYLEQWRDRFDLFHPVYPFYQVTRTRVLQFQEENKAKKRKKNPDKGTSDEKEKQTGQYTCAKLIGTISQSGNKYRLFPNRLGSDAEELSPAEAARWLLHINGYDDTAAKTGTSFGWLGQLGSIYAEGDSLFQTLVLNLTFRMDGTKEWGACVPIWEVETKDEIPTDMNPAWTLTLQSRHIWLEEKNGMVISYYVTGGEPSPEPNDFSEQLTVWKYTKKEGSYFPVPHEFSKQIWREFSTIADNGTERHCPGVVAWIAVLRGLNQSPLNRGDVIRFRTLSAAYGASNSSIANLYGDTLSFHASLLTDIGAVMRKWVEDEINHCGKIVKLIGDFAQDLYWAAEGSGDAKLPKKKAEELKKIRSYREEQYYYRIDEPFRIFLLSLDPDDSGWEERFKNWRKQAVQLAMDLGREMAEEAGSSAFAGRYVERKGKKEKQLCSTPKAYGDFRNELWKLEHKGGVSWRT